MSDDTRDPFHGRFAAIMNVEGEDDPIVLFRDPGEAPRELARRQALHEDDDDHLSEYHQIFTTDVVGVFWNSYDPDPRAGSPLGPEEIVSAYEGDGRLVNGGGDIAEIARLAAERDEARTWVRRLTAAERVLTCAFCGEAYPPGTPETNHERLTEHVLACAKHPMREVERERNTARADGAREERVKSSALIATLRELLEEREWDFEDNGRESNSCRTCGVTLRHGDPMKHAPGCALDAALRGDQ